MRLLHRMTARHPLGEVWKSAIESIPNPVNPTQSLHRVKDVQALQAIADVVETPRLVCVTDNAALALLPIERLPASVKRVEFTRSECLDAVRSGHETKGREVHAWRSPTGGLDTTVLADASDLPCVLEELRAELSTGRVKRVFLYNSRRAWVRRWLEAHAKGLEVEHLVASQGLVAISEQGQEPRIASLAPAIGELADEAAWFPPRLANTLGVLRRHPVPTVGVKESTRTPQAGQDLSGLVESEVDRNAIVQLLERAARLLRDIQMHAIEAYPPCVFKSRFEGDVLDLSAVGETVEAALTGGDQRSDAFLRAITGEQWVQATRAASVLQGGAQHASGVTVARCSALYQGLLLVREMVWWGRYWDVQNNRSWRPILDERCPRGTLMPKPIKPLQEYMDFYWLGGAARKPLETEPSSRHEHDLSSPILALRNLDHTARKLAAAQLCGFVMTRLAARYPNETIRWLDVGCGDGAITNGAEIPAWLIDRVEVLGLEFGETQVGLARGNAAKGRRFEQIDALEPPERLLGTKFHLITAFEFLEHLFDPSELLHQYKKLDPDFVIGGSPLNEGQPTSPSSAHTWSYGREGYEAVFREAGFDITYSVETLIGSTAGDRGWLTVVGAGNGLLEHTFPPPVRQIESKHAAESHPHVAAQP